MNHDAMRAAYDELLRARAPRDRSACPSAEALLALVERSGSDAERLATLDHAMACAACESDLALIRLAAAAAHETTGEERTLLLRREGAAARRRPIRVRTWTALAAGLVLAIGFGALARRDDPSRTPEQGPVLRGAEPTVTLLPAERAADGSTVLRWRGVPGALRYRVDVFASAGSTVVSAEVRDTTFVLQGAATARDAGQLRWMVTAVRESGGDLRSPAAPVAP